MASHYDDGLTSKTVVDDGSSPGLEIVPQFNDTYKHGISAANDEVPAASWGHTMQEGQRTIFQLRRTTFILSLVLLLVITAAAVGGGVGRSMAIAQARESYPLSQPRPAARIVLLRPLTRGTQDISSSAGKHKDTDTDLFTHIQPP